MWVMTKYDFKALKQIPAYKVALKDGRINYSMKYLVDNLKLTDINLVWFYFANVQSLLLLLECQG